MKVTPVDGIDDPRVADYRSMRRFASLRMGRRFVAEGTRVIVHLLASPLRGAGIGQGQQPQINVTAHRGDDAKPVTLDVRNDTPWPGPPWRPSARWRCRPLPSKPRLPNRRNHIFKTSLHRRRLMILLPRSRKTSAAS